MNIRKLGGLILLVALLGAYSASAESAVCYNADTRTVSWTQESCAPGRMLLTARLKGVTVWSAVCDASLGCYALPDSLRGEITLCVARIGHLDDDIRKGGLLQRGLERLHQMVRQSADKPYRVHQQQIPAIR